MSEFTTEYSQETGGTVIERAYKLIALRGIVVFPGQTITIDLVRDKSLTAFMKAQENDERDVVVVAQKHSQMLNPGPKDLYKVGVLCRARKLPQTNADIMRVLLYGISRVVIEKYVSISPCFEVTVSQMDSVVANPNALEAASRQIKKHFVDYLKLDNHEDIKDLDFDNLEKAVNTIGASLYRSDAQKQQLLEEPVLEKQIEDLCAFMARESEIIKTEKVINARVRKQIDKNQREYYLREQQKAINEELGEGEDEFTMLKERARALKLPEEAQIKFNREIKRLENMMQTTPEAALIRNYLDWILDIPWHKQTKDNTDLERAQRILDEEHFGLEKVKERIVEFLAVHQLTKSLKGPILCFVGPPGVGKTSIVKSIAKTLDRKFVSMSLGGMRDEAEIRGHRRTYIGAIPGRIVSQMKMAGTINPVFLFDEIDKMSSDYKGDPASAMLEVLDPEQNYQFRDNFLDMPYDLSKVMFITTANSTDSMPAPLLDRMEVIELSGYTEEEKVEIAKRHLIPKTLKANGLDVDAIRVSDCAIKRIISSYTRESGVRGLEREFATLSRKIAKKIISKKDRQIEQPIEIGEDGLEEYFGAPRYLRADLSQEDLLGAATGLAWTSVGGKLMTIEIATVEGKGEIIITGNLGSVMKESAQTALTLVKKRAKEYGISQDVFSHLDIHIHVPEGATPKDGPSAGITIATAILSALSNKKVRRDVAMTGEITLRGNVLAIGGLKEKALAAYRAGVKTLILPQTNLKDWQEIPQSVQKTFEVVFATDVDEVFKAAIIND